MGIKTLVDGNLEDYMEVELSILFSEMYLFFQLGLLYPIINEWGLHPHRNLSNERFHIYNLSDINTSLRK